METIAAGVAKYQLKKICDLLLEDSSSSVLIERNKKPAAMVLDTRIARMATLNAYSTGMFNRSMTMNLLGFTWYGELIDAMAKEDIAMPRVSAAAEAGMVGAMLGVLPKQAKPKGPKA